MIYFHGKKNKIGNYWKPKFILCIQQQLDKIYQLQ
jgi:hypothetical protein